MKRLLVSRLPNHPNAQGLLIPLQIGITPYLHGDQLNKTARELMDELRIDCKNCEYRPVW